MQRLLLLLALLAAGCCFSSREANATACTAGCAQYAVNESYSGTTDVVSLTSVGAGNDIRGAWCSPGTFVSLTDSGATTVAHHEFTLTSKNCGVFAASNSTSSSHTITLTTSACTSGCDMAVEEWAGDTATPLDAYNAGYVGSALTNTPCGSFTITGSNETISTWLFAPSNTNAPTLPAGYTSSFSAASPGYWWGSYQTSLSAGSYNPTWVSGTAQYYNYAICAGFLHSGGGPGTIHSLMMMGVGQ